LQIKTSLLVRLSTLSIVVADFGVKVAHLGVFLDVEAILHISSNAEAAVGVYSNHPAPRWSFEDMQLNDTFLACRDNSELT